MAVVIVEFWGPVERTNGYAWLPLGRLDADSLDVDYLKGEAMKMVEKMEQKPHTNALRLEVLQNGKRDMKITLTDLW